jgi:hypothetical protein
MPSPVTTTLADGPADLTGQVALEHPELRAAVGRDERDSA